MESHSKTCGKCKETKPRKEFSKYRRAKDGLQYQCKACAKQYGKQYYQENREQARGIIESVGHASLRLMFDCHHVQLMEYFKQYR